MPFKANPVSSAGFTIPVITARTNHAAETLQMAIRPSRKEDLPPIAEIHQSQFCKPGALLGHLSPALIAALYAAFLDRSVFLVHCQNGVVDGFVLGGSSRAMLACRLSFFRRRALSCILEVARRPHRWLLALGSFFKLIRIWLSSQAGASPPDEFRLISIAVAANATRKGIGTALVESFEAAIRQQSSVYCLHVLKSNATAIRFYEKLAFERVGETAISWILRKAIPVNADTPEPRSS
jgi:ribosomal protein S18 acetylase RimI-like enzyme